MSIDIEDLIRNSGLRYVKEVAPNEGKVTFSFPFDTSGGPILVHLDSSGTLLSTSTFVRNLDSVCVPSRKDLYLQLLKLNARLFGYARVGIWSSPPQEQEWALVTCDLPLAEASQEFVKLAIQDTAYLAEQVIRVIQDLVPSAQKQPT